MPAMNTSRPSLPAQAGRLALAAALAAALLSPAAAQASDAGKAERYYSKGLAELHAGHAEAAMALFQKAVEADPNDVRGLYYRGLGYGRAGHYAEAAADLEKVVAAGDPSIERDRLELGYAYYRLERYDDAAAQLEIAAQKPGRTQGEATMLLGIVESRRGNHEAAQAALSKVERLDPTKALAARYYIGLDDYRAGKSREAQEHFDWVSMNGGDSPFAREANAFLRDIREGGHGKPYILHAGLAFEYDSNVVLAPDNGNVAHNVYGISNKDDGRAVYTAGAKYSVLSTPSWQVAFAYDFLATQHFDLDAYDVQTHRVGGDVQYLTGPFTLGLAGAYEFSLLDEDSLYNGGILLPWLRYDEGALGRAEVYYRMRHRDFIPSDFDPVRNGTNHAAGARQFFSIGSRERSIILGYRFDADVADENIGEQYDYTGNQIETGIDWDFGEGWLGDAIFTYENENYDGASAGPTTGDREDNIYQVITRLQKRLGEYVWLNASYVFVRNDSNQVSFDYTRHITSLGVEVRY